MAILTGVGLNISVVLICISFMVKELNAFSCIYWPFLLLLLRIAYPIHVPIQFMCPFLHWVVDSLEVEFFEFPVDSRYESIK
jgi:hypothetical protein